MADRGGYGLVPQSNFAGGLNLATQADAIEPAQAIDLRDVVFPATGGIRQRDAYRRLTPTPLTQTPWVMAPYYNSAGAKHLLVGRWLGVDAVNVSGSVVGTTAFGAFPRSFARFGAPGSELMFMATGFDPLMTWNGVAFATPAYTGVTPTGMYLATQATDSRLVVARESGFPDRVRFSNPGIPTSWAAIDYVDLRPGSGEPITAMASWHEYVFAFKETEFFVFYGNSVNSLGNAEFNYRPVSDKAGSLGNNNVAVAPEGVYFMDRRGVWLTQGNEPRLVSGAIDGIFTNVISPYYTGGILNQQAIRDARMAYLDGKLYVAYYGTNTVPGGIDNNRLLVYDTKTGAWSLFMVGVTALSTFQSDGGVWPSDYSRDKLVIGQSNKHLNVYWEGSGWTMDGADISVVGGGSPITSHWRQSWQDFGSSDQKWLRQTKLFGTGSVRAGVQTDYLSSTGTLDTATMSSAGDAIAKPWLLSQSRVGHLFSLYVASNGEPWSLNSIEHGFRQGRGPEILGKRT